MKPPHIDRYCGEDCLYWYLALCWCGRVRVSGHRTVLVFLLTVMMSALTVFRPAATFYSQLQQHMDTDKILYRPSSPS